MKPTELDNLVQLGASRHRSRAHAALMGLLVALLAGGAAGAGNPLIVPAQSEYVPDSLKKVSVDEHLSARVPGDLKFVDETGKAVALSSYFDGRRPVILQLGYFGCPMLCDLVSQGLVTAVKDLGLDANKDYQFLYVSIDPKETAKLAAQKKNSYVSAFGKPESAGGLHFLTGQFSEIKVLTETVGFNYQWVPAQQQYSHPAVLVVLTPDGTISRYLYGVRFDRQTLRLSLVEASNGKIGSTTDKFILTCLVYDGTQGRYTASAMAMMRYGGVLTMLVLGFVLWRLFRLERKRTATSN